MCCNIYCAVHHEVFKHVRTQMCDYLHEQVSTCLVCILNISDQTNLHHYENKKIIKMPSVQI